MTWSFKESHFGNVSSMQQKCAQSICWLVVWMLWFISFLFSLSEWITCQVYACNLLLLNVLYAMSIRYFFILFYFLWCVFVHFGINSLLLSFQELHVRFLLSCRNQFARNPKNQRFVCHLYSFFFVHMTCLIEYWVVVWKKMQNLYRTVRL